MEITVESQIQASHRHAEAANRLVLVTENDYAEAVAMRNELRAAITSIIDFIEPMRKAAHAAYSKVLEQKKDALAPLEDALQGIDSSMIGFKREQDRLLREEKQRLQLAAEAEAKRVAAEESARLTEAEIDSALREGDEGKAESFLENPVEVAVRSVFVSAAPAVGSGEVKDRWVLDEESVDLVTFLQAVKDGRIKLEMAAKMLTINKAVVNSQIRSLGEAFDYPGLSAYNAGMVRMRKK